MKRFLGLFILAIILCSFLQCTISTSQPIESSLIKHVMSKANCSEYEAGLILQCVINQRGDDWDYNFLDKCLQVDNGNQTAIDDLNNNPFFKNYYDDFESDIIDWSHKSLAEKAAALSIDDICDEDEFTTYLNNCSSDEQAYIYERLEAELNQTTIICDNIKQTNELSVSEMNRRQQELNNNLNAIYRKNCDS
ncbi:MAG: hypothetical protein CfClM3_1114 [Methanobrevibacter sp. CfCl-M3]